MPNHIDRYQPSGFFRPATIALCVVGAVGGFLVAWLYQLAVRWIPIIYLNLLVCLGFGFLLGMIGVKAVKIGHCRSRLLATVLAAVLACGGVAGSWYWEYQNFRSLVIAEIQKEHPEAAREAIVLAVDTDVNFRAFVKLKAEHGWKVSSHGSEGSDFTGAPVYVVWGIEALMILGLALVMTFRAAGEPYCERCNEWGTKRAFAVPGVRAAVVQPLLAAGDLAAVIALQPIDEVEPVAVGDKKASLAKRSAAIILTVTLCPRCDQSAYLTVAEKQVTVPKRGKAKEKSTTLLAGATLNTTLRGQFLARLEPPAPVNTAETSTSSA